MEKRVRHVPYLGETLTLREVFFRCQDKGFIVCEVYKRDLLVWLFDTRVKEGTFFHDNQVSALEQLQGVCGVPKLLQKMDLEDNIKALIVERIEQESLTLVSSNMNKPPLIDHNLLTLGTCCLKIMQRLHDLHMIGNFINPDHIFTTKDGSYACSNFTLCFDREQTEIKQSSILQSPIFTNNNSKLQIRSYTQNLAQEDDFYNLGLLLYQMAYGNIDYKLEEGTSKLIVPSRPKRCYALVNTMERCLNPVHKQDLKAEDILKEFESQLNFSQYPAAVESSEAKSLQIMANITLSELSSSRLPAELKLRGVPKLGLFSSIGQSLIKATTDTEGWFISFIELSANSPDKELLNKILEKAWRKREKIKKLYEIVDKYLDNQTMIQNSLVASKCLIFMHLLLMRGPPETLSLPPPVSRKKGPGVEPDKLPKACSFAHHLILRIKEVWETIAKGDLKDKQDTYRSPGFNYLIYFYSVVLVEKCKFGLDYVNIFAGNFSIEPLKWSQDVKTIFSCKTYADLDNYASGFLLFYNLLNDDIDVPGIQFSILDTLNTEILNCVSIYCHCVSVYKKVAGCFEPRYSQTVSQICDSLENSLDHCIYRFHFLQEKLKNAPHFKIFSELFPFVSMTAVHELKDIDSLKSPIAEFSVEDHFSPGATIGTFVVPAPFGTSGTNREVSEPEKILFIKREVQKDVKSRMTRSPRKLQGPQDRTTLSGGYPNLVVSEDPTRTQSPENQGTNEYQAVRFSAFSNGANLYYNLDDEGNGIQKDSRSPSPSPTPSPYTGLKSSPEEVGYPHRNFKLDESFKSLGKDLDGMDKPLLDKADRKLIQATSLLDMQTLEHRLMQGDPTILEFLKKHAEKVRVHSESQSPQRIAAFGSGGTAFHKKREIGVQTELLDQILFLDDSSSPKGVQKPEHDLLNMKLLPESQSVHAPIKVHQSQQLTPREVLVSIPLPSKEVLIEKQLVSEVVDKSGGIFDLYSFIKEQVAKDVDDWIINFDDLVFGKEIANGSTCTVFHGDYRGLPVGML